MKIQEILVEKRDKKQIQKAFDRGAEDANKWIATGDQNDHGGVCPYPEDSEEASSWKHGWQSSYHTNFPDGDD